jgi:hypothetical protein
MYVTIWSTRVHSCVYCVRVSQIQFSVWCLIDHSLSFCHFYFDHCNVCSFLFTTSSNFSINVQNIAEGCYHLLHFVFFVFFLQKYLNSQVKLLRNYFTLFCIASSVSPCLVNNVIVILTPLNSSKNTCVFTEFWKWILNKHDMLYFLTFVSIALLHKEFMAPYDFVTWLTLIFIIHSCVTLFSREKKQVNSMPPDT